MTRCQAALIVSVLLSPLLPAQEEHGAPPYLAPFEKGEDSLCVNDWWNQPTPKNPKNLIIDLKVPRDQTVAFGIYTTHRGILKLTAQLYPLYPDETREVRLEIKEDNQWREVARQEVHELGWSTTFRIPDWDDSRDTEYRLLHGEKASFKGLVRRDPKDKKVITLAALSCNSNQDRGLRPEYTRNINHQNPDLIFFAGDQSYDHKQHTAAWLKFGLAFKELFRSRPCVTIPDDHDIGQGNLWGEGGKKASSMAGHDGGYFFHPEYVKMVERQQTGHLPDPFDPTPVEQGIGVYYTNLIVGDVDFAILEDRKFKTGPKDRHPMKGPRPDHIRDENYDPKVVDVPGLKLLGDRQLKFLNDWAGETEGIELKAVLSQTGFCGGAHLHGTTSNRLHADMDSNGWPQTGRNKALAAIKKANAVHIAGDQHLATVIQHGIDDYRDGPWAFVVPALVNTYYGRWWWPADEQPGGNPPEATALPWVGDYEDGFGNKITMHAYANPDPETDKLKKRVKFEDLPKDLNWGEGHGLIRFDKPAKTVTFECWPRHADLTKPGAEQYPGWPVTVELEK
ncbi:MAG: hypothetical protein Q7Q71_03560 [Verrucomicrobiota bacterium JB023]|nr:hypothetical protein [Verrucomicrobiota bacterium JB023]